MRNRFLLKRRVDEAEGKPHKSLDEWISEARECNMDYGNYRTLVEHHGKSFEQLKAQAGGHSIPEHSHIRAGRHD